MRLSLIDYTGIGRDVWWAADLLIFTKNTRVSSRMSPELFKEVQEWPYEKKSQELAYMADTIRSSWEFVDYVFVLEGVTRAFTHQLVRTRHASYAQQTMQVIEVDASDVELPRGAWMESDETRFVESRAMWSNAIAAVANAYRGMIKRGVSIEDARGLLPTNIKTNIIVKMNLRTLVETIHSRLGSRNLGEYAEVVMRMREEVLNVHPMFRVFVDSTRDRALARLDDMIKEVGQDIGAEPHTVDVEASRGKVNTMLKLVDMVRRG